MPAVRPLRADRTLQRTARRHARDMKRAARMTHYSPPESRFYPQGASPIARAVAEGYPTRYVGENVAMGYPRPAAVVRAWRRSPGHCVNMMRPAYRQVGAARVGAYWALVMGSRRR
jgi:uncharacterized protein YkwD